MWTTMEELNADFAKAFAVAAVAVTAVSFTLAYIFKEPIIEPVVENEEE